MNSLADGLKKLKQLHEDSQDFCKSWQGVIDKEITGESPILAQAKIKGQKTRLKTGSDYLERKVFVGNISYRVGEKQLKEFLTKFGAVTKVHIIKDRAKQYPRGIGFATFSNMESAAAAKAATPEERMLDGRELRIAAAVEKRFYKMQSQKMEHNKLQEMSLDLPNVGVLNNDALWHVFSHLNIFDLLNVEKVCQRWKSIALSVWASKRSLICKEFHTSVQTVHRLDNDALTMYLVRCPNLKVLDIQDSIHCLTFHSADAIAGLGKSLETLRIEKLEITNRGLELISESCPNLKTMSLKQCYAVGEKGLWSLLKNCQNLSQLEIADNPKFTGQCLERATQHLEQLIVSSCIKFGTGEKISTKCTNIKVLHLNNTVHELKDNHLRQILQNCTKVESFKMSKCLCTVSPDAMLHLSNLKNLKTLNLSHMKVSVTDTVLIEVCRHCKLLKSLDISNCTLVTDNGVKALSSLPNLQQLDMGNLTNVTSESLKSISLRGQLVSLSIMGCILVDETAPRQVVLSCPNLVMLNIANIDHIATQTVQDCIDFHHDNDRGSTLIIYCAGCEVEMENLCIPARVEVDNLTFTDPTRHMDFFGGYYDDIRDDGDISEDDSDNADEEYGYHWGEYDAGYEGYGFDPCYDILEMPDLDIEDAAGENDGVEVCGPEDIAGANANVDDQAQPDVKDVDDEEDCLQLPGTEYFDETDRDGDYLQLPGTEYFDETDRDGDYLQLPGTEYVDGCEDDFPNDDSYDDVFRFA